MKRYLLGALYLSSLCILLPFSRTDQVLAVSNESAEVQTIKELSSKDTNSNKNRSIIGTDDRVPVSDPTIAKYNGTVYVKCGSRMGTGIVVGKNTVITNGHVLKTWLSAGKDLTVIPARINNYFPFGSFSIQSVKIDPNWKQGSLDREDDIAVLTIAPNEQGKSIGEVVTVNTIVPTENMKSGLQLRSHGYPDDKKWIMQEAKGKVTADTTKNSTIFYFDFDTHDGQSGSPIYNPQNQLIGVNSGWVRKSGVYKNIGVKFDQRILKFIKKAAAQPITIEYKDSTGRKIFPTEKIEGNWQEDYQINPQVIFGYKFRATEGSLQGKIQDYEQKVTVTYEAVEVLKELPMPNGLAGVVSGDDTIYLSWNNQITTQKNLYYQVFRSGTRLTNISRANYKDTGLEAGKSYNYTVRLMSKTGIASPHSNVLTIRIPGKEEPKPEEPKPEEPKPEEPKPEEPKPEEPKPEVPKEAPWEKNKVYLLKDKVSYGEKTYRAKWWTRGDVPGVGQWGPWELIN